MKSKILFTIAFSTLFFACTKTDPNLVTITGEITNPIGESVTFSNQDTSYSTTANANGTFTISFNLDSATYLRFEHGPEGTAMYVYPGDKINLTIDTELFDETIEYKGSMSNHDKIYSNVREVLLNNDQINTILSIIAKKRGTKSVFSVVNNESFSSFANDLGIDVIINPRELTTSRIIEKISEGSLLSYHSILKDNLSLISFRISYNELKFIIKRFCLIIFSLVYDNSCEK